MMREVGRRHSPTSACQAGVGVQGGEVAVDAQDFGEQLGVPVRAQGLAVGERVAAVGAVKGGAGRDSWSGT